MSVRYELFEVFVLLLDIDYFKKYNDCYGYLVGDVVFVLVINIVKRVLVCDIDFILCWGGEEFVIVFLYINYEGC